MRILAALLLALALAIPAQAEEPRLNILALAPPPGPIAAGDLVAVELGIYSTSDVVEPATFILTAAPPLTIAGVLYARPRQPGPSDPPVCKVNGWTGQWICTYPTRRFAHLELAVLLGVEGPAVCRAPAALTVTAHIDTRHAAHITPIVLDPPAACVYLPALSH